MRAVKPLSPLDVAFQGDDTQFVVFNLQNYFVSDRETFAASNEPLGVLAQKI
jgi:hypothetical protein